MRQPSAPNLILKPRLPLALVGVTHAIELDYMVASDDALLPGGCHQVLR
jgi:hypothetical protein